MELYKKVFSQACSDVNEKILVSYFSLNNDDFKKKTHLFNGRYENIYLEANKIAELEIIINVALEKSESILNIKKEKLQFSFWLNEMNAGEITTAHTHDDGDEILSCVYYIQVPDNSGDFIFTRNNSKTILNPIAGEFIFFSPDTLHEVSSNESVQPRLSMAFNFGLM